MTEYFWFYDAVYVCLKKIFLDIINMVLYIYEHCMMWFLRLLSAVFVVYMP